MSELTLIAGCGYLGTVLARELLAVNRPVLALTRQESSAAALRTSGIPTFTCDLADATSVASIPFLPLGGASTLRIVHCAASGRGGRS